MAIICDPKCPPVAKREYVRPVGRRRRRVRQPAEHITPMVLYDCCDEALDDPTGWYIAASLGVDSFNLIRNPTAGNDLFSWSGFNSNLARTNEVAFDSGFSFRISGSGDTTTTENREFAETEIPINSLNKGDRYVYSAYVMLPEIWDVADPRMGAISVAQFDVNGNLLSEVFSEKLPEQDRWIRQSVGVTIDPNATRVVARVHLRSDVQRELLPPNNPTGRRNLKGEYLYFDALQFEPNHNGDKPSLFFHGSTQMCGGETKCCQGVKWLGQPHQSASLRPKCTPGKLVNLCEFGLEITQHTGHTAPPVRDISVPYANRIGESYQKTAVDPYVLTFTAYQCDISLEALECKLFDLMGQVMPSVGSCEGDFLLVYHHSKGECGTCEASKDRAICARYTGGFESLVRDSLFRHNLVLQFRANGPFFDFDGQQSVAIPIDKVIQQNRVIKINSDGTSQGFPIDPGKEVSSVGCLPGVNRVVIGGNFGQGSQAGVRAGICNGNLALFDCGELCTLPAFAGGAVNDIESDGAGNLVIGGSFTSPSQYLAILYGNTGQTGFFDGFTGGPALAVAAPSWSEVIVSGRGYVHILVDTLTDATQGWRRYVVEGNSAEVRDIGVLPNGNFIAVGDFSVIRGSGEPTVPSTNPNNLNRIGLFNVNVDGKCLDISRPEWQSLGFGFDGPVNVIEIDNRTGDIYVGGEFRNAIPDATSNCILNEGNSTESRGANQELIMTQVAGTNYSVTLRVTNTVAAQIAAACSTAAVPAGSTRYVRATVTNTGGTTYNFVLAGAATVTPGNPLTDIVWTMDINATLAAQCSNINPSIVTEYDNSRGGIGALAATPLTNGNGNDNTINAVTFQCLTLQTTFQGNPIPVNRVAKITGGTVQPLGRGLDANVRALMLHPETGELWAGTEGAPTGATDGLQIWNGQNWGNFPGNLAGRGPAGIRDIKYCKDDCSVIFAIDRDGASKLYGSSPVDYRGSFENMDAQIIVHGPGKLNHIGHHPCSKMASLCSTLQCGEVATMTVGDAQIKNNFGNNLGNSVLAGSRLDFWLKKCDQRMTVYVDEAGAGTAATLVYRDQHWGIEGLCCADPKIETKKNICCNSRNMIQSRAPTEDDCREQGHRTGDLWYDAFGCGSLYVLADDACCDPTQQGLMGQAGPLTTPVNGTATPICPPAPVCPTNPTTCPVMTITYVSPAGGTTQQNQGELTGLQPAIFDFPQAMNTGTVQYNIVTLVNLNPIPVTATWSNGDTRLTLTPTNPWPTTAKQLTFYQNATTSDNNCRILENQVFNFT